MNSKYKLNDLPNESIPSNPTEFKLVIDELPDNYIVIYDGLYLDCQLILIGEIAPTIIEHYHMKFILANISSEFTGSLCIKPEQFSSQHEMLEEALKLIAKTYHEAIAVKLVEDKANGLQIH